MRCNLPPPAFACWLLESVVPKRYREALIGDLIEEYAFRLESSPPTRAYLWFWAQTFRSFPALVWSSIRSGDCVHNIGVAIAVYTLIAILKLVTNSIIYRFFATGQMAHIVIAPILFLTMSAIGGYAAARIRRGAAIFLALMVMISVCVSIAIQVCTIPVPWWYQVGFLTLGPLAALITPAAIEIRSPKIRPSL
ncbi:MAG TPA: hypothetical protein VFG11_07890 [Acidobacteriota bacterium]|nr:hypothetical protein [Acidobacteriota bacterium]